MFHRMESSFFTFFFKLSSACYVYNGVECIEDRSGTMKTYVYPFIGLLLLFSVAACSDDRSATDVDGDIKELVRDLTDGKYENVSASITSDELIVTDHKNNKETVFPLPEDEFFVSIAPYIHTTHPCDHHNLTSCQGELAEKRFDVFIQDEEGRVIVDATMTSFANGFIDLWLPRNKTFQVKIEYDGKTSEAEISTFQGDRTCITTMQLS